MSSYVLRRARRKLEEAEQLQKAAHRFKNEMESLLTLDADELKMFRDLTRRVGIVVTNRRDNLARLEQQLMEQE